jgi:hypothetical protein
MSDQSHGDLERNYVFQVPDSDQEGTVRNIEVPESELTHEQIEVLTRSLHQFYNNMPGIVQDKFTDLLAVEMQMQRELSKKKHIITGEEMLKFQKGGEA